MKFTPSQQQVLSDLLDGKLMLLRGEVFAKKMASGQSVKAICTEAGVSELHFYGCIKLFGIYGNPSTGHGVS